MQKGPRSSLDNTLGKTLKQKIQNFSDILRGVFRSRFSRAMGDVQITKADTKKQEEIDTLASMTDFFKKQQKDDEARLAELRKTEFHDEHIYAIRKTPGFTMHSSSRAYVVGSSSKKTRCAILLLMYDGWGNTIGLFRKV